MSCLAFISPMLPSLSDEPPENGEWIHEIKHDGYRTQLVIQGEHVRAFTRNGYDWSDRYPAAIEAARELDCGSAIVDGEMIVQDQQGRSDFESFRSALIDRPADLVFMAFDLLHLNGNDLREEPLVDRRSRLQDIVGCHDPSCCLQFSDSVEGSGAEFFKAVDAMGLEGIVSKRKNSRYRSGRTKSWLKIKTFTEDEFIVIGTERAAGGPSCALLARESLEGLEYAGSALVTLSGPDRERFWRATEKLAVERPPLPMSAKGAAWVRPEMRVRARYLRGEAKVRHATLIQLVT